MSNEKIRIKEPEGFENATRKERQEAEERKKKLRREKRKKKSSRMSADFS